MTEVFMLIDEAHAHSTNEPYADDDPGTEMFRTAEQAKAYATDWVNRQLAAADEPAIEIEWTESDSGVFPMNLPDQVSYFQISRCQGPADAARAEEYFQQRGR
jgi:hypothetical protein